MLPIPQHILVRWVCDGYEESNIPYPLGKLHFQRCVSEWGEADCNSMQLQAASVP